MQVIDLSKNNSVLNNYIREIRDITIQADAMRFRRNMERIGEVIAIELSKSLKYKRIETQHIGRTTCDCLHTQSGSGSS